MKDSRIPDQAHGSPANQRAHSRGPVGASPDLPAIVGQLADLLGLLTRSAPVMIFLHDPTSNQYTLRRAPTPETPEEPETGFGPDCSIARWLGTHDQPLYLIDSPDHHPPLALTREELQALEGMVLLMPLHGEWGVPQERPRGWVALGSRPTGEPYGPEDLRVMAALVDRAGLAIENSHMVASMAELEQAQMEFMDFVAHELKQPMTSMKGYAKMLMLGIGGELTAAQSQFAQVITANVDRMGRMVNDLLEISRLEAGRIKLTVEPLQPWEILDEALAAIKPDAEERGHTLVADVPGELPLVDGDRNRLLQILAYLLSNACRYTPDGGTIRASISEPDPAAAPGYLLFSIRDTGIGISAEELVRLDKFFRADHDLVISQPGLGLGISIARGLIALHGGELMIESEANRGSTFSFTVPVGQGAKN